MLDWGRGVWTYHNTWYWGSTSGQVDGIPFGWNIGYGFGNTSAASENMLFYGGRAHKLSQVQFHIPMRDGREDYLRPWTFTSDDGRFEMDFVPDSRPRRLHGCEADQVRPASRCSAASRGRRFSTTAQRCG